MSKLRNETIRLAYKTPELRPHLLPLLKDTGIKTAKVPTYEEFLDNIKVNNPGTDGNEKVKIRTLKNSPKDSEAHREYLKLKKQWDQAVKEDKKEKGEDSDDDEEDSSEEGTDAANEEKDKKAEEESKNFIAKNKGKLKGAINTAKETIKQKFKEFNQHEVSFGELVEMCLGLVVTLFNESEGEKLLSGLMDTIDARNDETFKEALSQLKAAEASATLSDDSKKLMEKMGLDPTSNSANNDKIKEWLTDPKNEGEPIPDDVMDEILDFFFQITEGHMKFLRLFVKGNGDIDIKRLKDTLEKGIPDELKDQVEEQKKKDKEEKNDEDDDEEKDKKESTNRVLARTALADPLLRYHIVPFLLGQGSND